MAGPPRPIEIAKGDFDNLGHQKTIKWATLVILFLFHNKDKDAPKICIVLACHNQKCGRPAGVVLFFFAR